jgi:hypothetical protein
MKEGSEYSLVRMRLTFSCLCHLLVEFVKLPLGLFLDLDVRMIFQDDAMKEH